MIKRLPVLYKTENNVYQEIELKKPSGAEKLASCHEELRVRLHSFNYQS